ncbi:sugar ABC transporter ATP-binding protein [Paenibacillus humicola]|uniref:sugar ABC transporter ATP-binding protein n=1 Tax=Paenibacillus humicola TaxID=3110540 RepID=UPI00237B4B15|nr:sugar ABC transporter ATP-binding protein [Paenibacillus humicola]
MDNAYPVLELRRISKTFFGQRALQDIDLTIEPGEVHGLLGQNGSGKSTLIKVLAGFHAPDPGGELRLGGQPVKLPVPAGEFRKLGMSFVHQDLGLIPSLSVIENLLMSEFASKSKWRLSWRAEIRRAKETFARFGLDLDPKAKVADLSPVEKALLAIVRAIEEIRSNGSMKDAGPGLLILDEPTVFLPRTGVDQLFRLVREVAETGVGVIFVSHDLDEVMEITDRVSILKDGRLLVTAHTEDVTKETLVETIIGRKLASYSRETNRADRPEPHVTVRGLSGNVVRDVSLELGKGEVLGLTGLAGSGFEEIPYLLYGEHPASSGRIEIGGKAYEAPAMTPIRAIEGGMALIPADRPGAGGVDSLTIADNVTLPVIGQYFKHLRLDRGRMLADTQSLLSRYEVRPNRPALNLQALSGGNQQKVILAKWFQIDPKLVLLDEPTQGIDVGAREQVYDIIKTATKEGTSVLCASSDYEQLASICDRVLIFARGRIIGELQGSELTKDRITERCYNSLDIGIARAT